MGLFKLNELAFAKNGLATGVTAEDIAKKHGVPLEEIERQLEMGMEVELEHTSDLDKARDIALDHLAEIPDYYDRLAEMEKQAKNQDLVLQEAFSQYLLSEMTEPAKAAVRILTESEISSDQDIRDWAEWKLTKFNLMEMGSAAAEAFLLELGDLTRERLAVMPRREKIARVTEAAERMPKSLKKKMMEMDGMKGDKRSKMISAALKSLKV
jgi:hypothetical protein